MRCNLLLFPLGQLLPNIGKWQLYYGVGDYEWIAVEKRGTQGAILQDVRWNAGQHLQVYFMDGKKEEHENIKKYAPEWTEYANLHFDFVDKFNSSAPPHIRIKFEGVSGFSSLLGTD